jgi:chromosome segregation ATPase
MSETDKDDLLKRMSTARETAEEMKTKKSRLSGELETHEKRLEELEGECVEKFGISVEELPEKIESLRKEAKELLSQAEAILGVQNE